MALSIRTVPALTDNYLYLLKDTASGQVAVVDPSTAEAVIEDLEKSGWNRLDKIFNTHHHWDHVGGNEKLQNRFGSQIFCSSVDEKRVQGKVSGTFQEGCDYTLGDTTFRIFEIPGHTLGHVALYFESAKAVFVGDTLFGMGCGRLFEGTAQQMWNSLCRLGELPEDTLVYCGHEYTLNNGRFALSLGNPSSELQARTLEAARLRKAQLSTVPFSIGEEKKTNPFWYVPRTAKTLTEQVALFAGLRKRKDDFA